MFQNCKNKTQQGLIGLSEAVSHFIKQGYVVSIPIADNQEYDLVVDIDGLLFKVQVKTSAFKANSGNYTVELRTRGGSSDSCNKVITDTNVDFFIHTVK